MAGYPKRGDFKRSFRPDGGSRPMFDAECAKCRKVCSVPFEPNGKKPVYCKDCFVRPEGDAPRSFDRDGRHDHRRDERRDFRRDDQRDDRRDRSFERSAPQPVRTVPDPRIDDLKRDIAVLAYKLDALVSLVSTLQPASHTESSKVKTNAVAPKVAAKKKKASIKK